MIDTICLKHVLRRPLSDSQLFELGAVEPRGKRHRTFVINSTNGSYAPSLSFTTTPDGVQHVSERFSASRLIFGHNAELPTILETFGSIFAASDYFERRTGIEFDPYSANVAEVHFARDIDVGENRIIPILHALSTRLLPGHKRVQYDDTGTYFQRKQSTLVVYSKLHEVQGKAPDNKDALAASRGKLRIECRLSSRAIQSLKLDDRTTRTVLTDSLSDHFIDRAIEQLALKDAMENSERPPALERLDKLYTPTKAERLFGFLGRVNQYGQKFYLNSAFGYDARKFNRLMRECRRAGVWPGDDHLGDSGHILAEEQSRTP